VLADRAPIARWAASDSTYGAQASACTPITPEGDHQQPRRRRLPRDLQTQRALSGDDLWVVEGGHERLALARGEGGGGLRGLVIGALDQVDLAAVPANCRHLGQRRVDRHEQIRAGTEPVGDQGHGLGMVAGARRRDPPVELVPRKASHHVKGTADLEGTGELKALGFQHHRGADPAREPAGGKQRRLPDLVGDQLGRALDVGGGDRTLRSAGP
jgi:hypothetical protein